MIDSTAVIHKAPTMDPTVFTIVLGVIVVVSAFLGYQSVRALAARGPDDKGIVTTWALLKTFPSTGARIIVELALSVLYVVVCMLADMIGRPVSEGTQNTLGFFIAAMLGIGAGQFLGKRTTDEKYQKAKTEAIIAANASPPPPTPTSPTPPAPAVVVNNQTGDQPG